jgi:hypothetical protein
VIGLEGHELEHGLKLSCVDKHRNPVPLGDASATHEYYVEFAVEAPAGNVAGAPPPDARPPQLEGETRVPIGAGGVALVRNLSVTPSSFVPAVWCLVARAVRRARDSGESWTPLPGVGVWRSELALRDAEKAAADARRPGLDPATRIKLKNMRAEAETQVRLLSKRRAEVSGQLGRARQASQHMAGSVVRASGTVESAVQQLRQLCSAAPSQSTERVGSARIECAMYNGVAVPTVALKPLPLNGERVDEALGVATLLCQALDAAAAHTRESGARPATIRGGALGHQLLGEARTVPDNGGVIGVLWDLFFCDNEKEAVVLAALLSTNLRTVVVHSAEHMTLWRNRLQSYEGQVTILALELAHYESALTGDREMRDEQWGERLIDLVPPAGAPRGFVDYAVNRIVIRGAHAPLLLRRKIAYPLLGRAMIFDTMQNAIDFRRHTMRADPSRKVPAIGVLETGEILSTMGSMSIGKGAKNDQMLGSAPRSETPIARTVAAVLDAARQLSAAAEGAAAAHDGDTPLVRSLEQQLADVQADEERAQAELADIERELQGAGAGGASQMSQAAVSQAAALTQRPTVKRAGAPTIVGDLGEVVNDANKKRRARELI